ncbi:MAG: hypothetical protein D6816_10675 [Bacteroidetes bacterium]|nr:MAG: hypothetical protein D6816_10675 [Bacteroidota bacterium]
MNTARLASAYRALLDKKEALTREYKAKVKEIDEALNEIEDVLLQFMKDNDLSSLSFDEISFSLREKTMPNVNDWDALFEFVAENHAFELLKKGVKATEVARYLEEHEALPPGVSVERMQTLSHRRK